MTAWLEAGLGDAEATRRAAARGVILPSAGPLRLEPGPGQRFILGFAGMSPARLREGVRQLAASGL